MNPDQNCWPSRDGLRIGHLNINHILNKTTDVTTTISNSGKQFHLFGCSESRLTDSIPYCTTNQQTNKPQRGFPYFQKFHPWMSDLSDGF